MSRIEEYNRIKWDRLRKRLEDMYASRLGGWCGQDVATVNYAAGEDHMLKMVLNLMDTIDGEVIDYYEE